MSSLYHKTVLNLEILPPGDRPAYNMQNRLALPYNDRRYRRIIYVL